jgi:hypothetical protein
MTRIGSACHVFESIRNRDSENLSLKTHSVSCEKAAPFDCVQWSSRPGVVMPMFSAHSWTQEFALGNV